MSKRKRDKRPTIVVAGYGASDKVRRAGGNPVHVGNTSEDLAEGAASDNVHGLLLLGGGDVNPERYGMRADGTCYGISDDRDAAELMALDESIARGLPTLGICRGSQIMNVAAGGTLHLDIELDAMASKFHGGHEHRVLAAAGSRLEKAWAARGEAKERFVTSIHHQAVAKLGAGMMVAATSRDGIVEAIESVDPNVWNLGVQFHPEMARNDYSQRIFDQFVEAAASFAGLPRPTRQVAPVQVPASPKAKPVHHRAPRKAREYTSTKGGPVTVAYKCFRCGIRFDLEPDFVDHCVMLHGDEFEIRSDA